MNNLHSNKTAMKAVKVEPTSGDCFAGDFWELITPYLKESGGRNVIPLHILIPWFEAYDQDVMEIIDIAIGALLMAQLAASASLVDDQQWNTLLTRAIAKGLVGKGAVTRGR